MKAASIAEIKKELKKCSQTELVEPCLRLAKFKKESKELLTYLLFEAEDEQGYINNVKEEIDEQFNEINKKSFYFIKKGVRKILRNTKKYIRYSKNKETEVELLIYYLQKIKSYNPRITHLTVIHNLCFRELESVKKKITRLHEDLQYDYQMIIEEIFN